MFSGTEVHLRPRLGSLSCLRLGGGQNGNKRSSAAGHRSTPIQRWGNFREAIWAGFRQIMGEFRWILARNWDFQGAHEQFQWILARNWDLVISTGHFDRISMNLMMMIFIGDYRWGLLFAILSWIRVTHQAVTGGHHLVLIYPIGSMVLLYMVTWIPSIYPLYVSINIPAPWIHMDPSWVLCVLMFRDFSLDTR